MEMASASGDKLFPPQRGGSSDSKVLEQLGLSEKRMQEEDGAPDILFFHQLLFPTHNIDNDKVLAVPNGPQKVFYSNVSRWTNLHAAGELGILGGGHGHEYESTAPAKLM